jgi:hypothetical protein
MSLLPTDPKERKKIPLWSGLFKYFPDALIAVAKVSYAGNEQHNPGQKLQWSREKSSDHEDTLLRHLMESGSVDSDGQLHSAKLVWRALAKLQLEIEASKKEEKQATGDLYWRGTTIPISHPEPKQPASHNDWDGISAL